MFLCQKILKNIILLRKPVSTYICYVMMKLVDFLAILCASEGIITKTLQFTPNGNLRLECTSFTTFSLITLWGKLKQFPHYFYYLNYWYYWRKAERTSLLGLETNKRKQRKLRETPQLKSKSQWTRQVWCVGFYINDGERYNSIDIFSFAFALRYYFIWHCVFLKGSRKLLNTFSKNSISQYEAE